ncbi:hypothetical protein RHMOL_Rhmol01G0368400 [Rhododendron molle]|uniref:Uncharacterized protein n=1 Tax=Rhododendron molle TaxID=49168 RepID=A0ACC0QBM2_RHOML|nr:hypothetical protein RHMOL_Rhmol01G0368400 [Rhododendron molle]
MEVIVLELKDVDDWIYRGEGAVNLFLAYSGSTPTFVCSFILHSYDDFVVLERYYAYKRLPGLNLPETDTIVRKVIQLCDECLLWRETEDLIRVYLSKEFLEVAEKNILSQCPSRQGDAAMVNTLCDFALLMSDHSVFPYCNHYLLFTKKINKNQCVLSPCK